MWIVRLALRRPFTFLVMAVLIAILGITSVLVMPTDIFPYINIPVVSIVWSYPGVSPDEMEKRIVRASTLRSVFAASPIGNTAGT
jgi:multidrug efflux pump subunit AcrB